MKAKYALIVFILLILVSTAIAPNENEEVNEKYDEHPEQLTENDVQYADSAERVDTVVEKRPDLIYKLEPEQLAQANPGIVRKVGKDDAKRYIDKRLPDKEKSEKLNDNELILYEKAYPNVNTNSLKTVEGVKFGKGFLETKQGGVDFGDSNVKIVYSKDGLKIGDIILIKGYMEIDSKRRIIFKPNSEFMYNSLKNKNVIISVTKETEFGSSEKGISYIVERKDKRMKDGKWVDTSELVVTSLIGNYIKIKTKDNAYDNINVNKLFPFEFLKKFEIGKLDDERERQQAQSLYGYVEFVIEKNNGGSASIIFPPNQKPLLQNIQGLEINFHTFLYSDGKNHNLDLININGKREVFIDSELYGSLLDKQLKLYSQLNNDLWKDKNIENQLKIIEKFFNAGGEIKDGDDLCKTLVYLEKNPLAQNKLIDEFKGDIDLDSLERALVYLNLETTAQNKLIDKFNGKFEDSENLFSFLFHLRKNSIGQEKIIDKFSGEIEDVGILNRMNMLLGGNTASENKLIEKTIPELKLYLKLLKSDGTDRDEIINEFLSNPKAEIKSSFNLGYLLEKLKDKPSAQNKIIDKAIPEVKLYGKLYLATSKEEMLDLTNKFVGDIKNPNNMIAIQNYLKGKPKSQVKIYLQGITEAKLGYTRELAFDFNRLHDQEMDERRNDLRIKAIEETPTEILYGVMAQGEESYDSTFEAVHGELKSKLEVGDSGLYDAYKTRVDPEGELIGDVIGTYARYGYLKDIVPKEETSRNDMIEEINNQIYDSKDKMELKKKGGELSRAINVMVDRKDSKAFTESQLIEKYEQSVKDDDIQKQVMFESIIYENKDRFSSENKEKTDKILEGKTYLRDYQSIPEEFTRKDKSLTAVYYFHRGQEGYMSGMIDSYQGKEKKWVGDKYEEHPYAKTIKGYTSDVKDSRTIDTQNIKTVTMTKDIDGKEIKLILTRDLDKFNELTKSEDVDVYAYAGHSTTRYVFWDAAQEVKEQKRPVVFYDGGCGGAKSATTQADEYSYPISNLKTGKGQTNNIVFYYTLEKLAQGKINRWDQFKEDMKNHAKEDVSNMQFPGDPEIGILKNFEEGIKQDSN